MKFFKNLILTLLLALSSFTAIAQVEPSAYRNYRSILENRSDIDVESQLQNFKHIALDVRGSRGGKGDVAAGYLTAADLVHRLHFKGRITFLVDDLSISILTKLTGSQIELGKKIATISEETYAYKAEKLPSDLPAADLYLALAQPSGFLRENADSGWNPFKSHPLTVKIAQTVLGNTENRNSSDPFGGLEIGQHEYHIRPAGLAPYEAGIYLDPVAVALREKSRDERLRFLNENLSVQCPVFARAVVEALINGQLLAGSTLGLVYGITHKDVHAQFEAYLEGLAQALDDGSPSFTLLTPSGFSVSQIKDPNIARRLVVNDTSQLDALADSFPKRAEPGKIYILKTGSIPHPAFISLLALSEIPPIVAGDGALSAAITLGIPFVSTRVAWNQRNIENLRLHLLALAKTEEEKTVINEVYGVSLDLSKAPQTKRLAGLFTGLQSRMRNLTDTLIGEAILARQVQSGRDAEEEVAAAVQSPYLKQELLVEKMTHEKISQEEAVVEFDALMATYPELRRDMTFQKILENKRLNLRKYPRMLASILRMARIENDEALREKMLKALSDYRFEGIFRELDLHQEILMGLESSHENVRTYFSQYASRWKMGVEPVVLAGLLAVAENEKVSQVVLSTFYSIQSLFSKLTSEWREKFIATIEKRIEVSEDAAIRIAATRALSALLNDESYNERLEALANQTLADPNPEVRLQILQGILNRKKPVPEAMATLVVKAIETVLLEIKFDGSPLHLVMNVPREGLYAQSQPLLKAVALALERVTRTPSACVACRSFALETLSYIFEKSELPKQMLYDVLVRELQSPKEMLRQSAMRSSSRALKISTDAIPHILAAMRVTDFNVTDIGPTLSNLVPFYPKLREGFHEAAVDPKRDASLRTVCISTLFSYPARISDGAAETALSQLSSEKDAYVRYVWAKNLFEHRSLGHSEDTIVRNALIEHALAGPFASRSEVENLLAIQSHDPRLIEVYIKIGSEVREYATKAMDKLRKLSTEILVAKGQLRSAWCDTILTSSTPEKAVELPSKRR